MEKVTVSTPSRICLFGEHLDYLGLEVIAAAINLRFFAEARKRTDRMIHIKIRDERVNTLNQKNVERLYENKAIDLDRPIEYEHKRDYLKSSVNILLKKGYVIHNGYDIVMDSEIPIGKGMSSSSTMIIALIKSLLEALESKDKDDRETIAKLGFLAEVAEFQEPGGMMDHYTSALGDLVHLDFNHGTTKVRRIDMTIPGCFILFDSLETKNTTKVLADAKNPVLEAMRQLEPHGIRSIRDFQDDETLSSQLRVLDDRLSKKLRASIDNYRILKKACDLLNTDCFDPVYFGELISAHHANLRDGLSISSPRIEKILDTAMQGGALGGKVNGSGGGGCCFVYANQENAQQVLDSVAKIGYPGKVLMQDSGVRLESADVDRCVPVVGSS